MRSPLSCILAGAAGAVVATVAPLLLSTSSAQTQLLPFQGRLTDAAGNAVGDGARVVEFKLYDAPTGGNVKWAGEVHKLSVNGGLVNTMLGSKASLGGVDFATATFLQITVDANGDGAITAADPPLLPRQSVVPAVFAMESRTARSMHWVDGNGVVQGSANWSALFGPGANPSTATLSGSRITQNSIAPDRLAVGEGLTDAYLASGSVKTDELNTDAVTTAKIKDGEVKSADIGDGEVRTGDLAGAVVAGAETVAGAVTSDKIKDGTILGRDVADEALPVRKLMQEYAVFWDERGNTEPAGTPVAGWNKRTLNQSSISSGSAFATRTGDTITLEPGVYWVRASAPGFRVRRHAIALRDVTGNPVAPVVALKGTTEHCSDVFSGLGEVDQNRSFIDGFINVTGGPRQFELWHWIQVPSGGGLGSYPDAVGPGWSLWALMSIIKLK